MTRFSVVIPAYNEQAYLPRLLDSVDLARASYLGGPEEIEVIVADNRSTDATAAIASKRGCRVSGVEERVIAAARNAGAAVARGDVFCFVDADLVVHRESFNSIDAVMAGQSCCGGATGWVLERHSTGLRATEAIVRGLTGLARIGAGMVFCRADVFRNVGGYDEDRRYAEDVVFFSAMRRVGKAMGLATVTSTNTPAVVSTRKFDTHGDWHMFAMLFWIPLRYGSYRKTIQAYWYDDDKRF